MVKVWKFQRVAQEEYGCVVSHQVPVTFFGIELNSETAYVTFRIGSTAFAGNGREADKTVCFFTYLAEYRGFCVFCDVICNGKSTIGT